jgi:hypothetical protein
LVIVTVPEKSQAIQARLSQRIRESIQQFLPARGSEAPKVVLMMGEIDHLNTAVTSVETLRDALSAALVPVALTTA